MNKIEWKVKRRNMRSKSQSSFRRVRGAQEAIAYLTSFTCREFRKEMIVVPVFLDIKGAYDHVSTEKIKWIRKLR